MTAVPDPAQVSVLIPAAGRGERLGRGPKAGLPLAGRPVLHWVVDKARQLGSEILVAAAPGLPVPADCRCIEGGATRQESVQRLAAAASRPWCLLWDAARPFASLALARAVLAAAAEGIGASACLASETTHVRVADGDVIEVLPARWAGHTQTPQAFPTPLLQQVTAQAAAEGFTAQSTGELWLHAGHPLRAVPGEKLNLKLTTEEDWLLAQALLDRLSC